MSTVTKDLLSCQQRIFSAIKFYQKLDLNNDNDQDKLMQYKENHVHLLEDFISIITQYNDKMDDVYDAAVNSIGKCNIQTCNLTTRHHRNRRNDKIKNDEKATKLNFVCIRDLFDSVHCYIFHQFDYGFRVYKNMQNQINSMSDINVHENKAHKANLTHKISPSKLFDESQFSAKCSKYSISCITSTDTFMDGLLKNNQNISTAAKTFFDQEEYDSDAIMDDSNESSTMSNIYHMCDKKICNKIREYIRDLKLYESTFSTGINFYYWRYYRKHRQTDSEDEWNVNDHGGYDIVNLYVECKYLNLKQEILNNNIYVLGINEYRLSLCKVIEFIDESIVKETKADVWGDLGKRLHYGIESQTCLADNNLLALILYTDWSELCTEFGNTFRQMHLYETLKSIKKRNREFAVWSRILRETVELFGHSGRGEFNLKKLDTGEKCNILRGPFYCGMSRVMIMTQFNIRLYGPTSTSKQMEVAHRFGGEQGMIIQLNNNSGDQRCDRVHAFNCSWISTYPGEDEWLFIGGDQRIKIESIRNVQTTENFETFFEPLFWFDCLVSGTVFKGYNTPNVTATHIEILNDLIQHSLDPDNKKSKCPPYIINTFQSFINNKKQIVFNLAEISLSFDKLKNLIISKDELFKQDVFKLFKNATQFIMYTSGNFKLFTLVTLAPKVSHVFDKFDNITKISIKSTYDPNETQQSWLFDQRSTSIIKMYANNDCCLDWNTMVNHLAHHQDILIISRDDAHVEYNTHTRSDPLLNVIVNEIMQQSSGDTDNEFENKDEEIINSPNHERNKTVQFSAEINSDINSLSIKPMASIIRHQSTSSVIITDDATPFRKTTMSLEVQDAMFEIQALRQENEKWKQDMEVKNEEFEEIEQKYNILQNTMQTAKIILLGTESVNYSGSTLEYLLQKQKEKIQQMMKNNFNLESQLVENADKMTELIFKIQKLTMKKNANEIYQLKQNLSVMEAKYQTTLNVELLSYKHKLNTSGMKYILRQYYMTRLILFGVGIWILPSNQSTMISSILLSTSNCFNWIYSYKYGQTNDIIKESFLFSIYLVLAKYLKNSKHIGASMVVHGALDLYNLYPVFINKRNKYAIKSIVKEVGMSAMLNIFMGLGTLIISQKHKQGTIRKY